MAEVTNICYTCHYILWTLRSQLLSDCSHFHPFKFVDNLTLPAEGEAEGSKIFLYCDYWACSHKTTYFLPKRSPSYPCIFSLPFLGETWVSCPFPIYQFLSDSISGTSSALPVLLALGCEMPISCWWFSLWDRLPSRTNLWLFPTKPKKMLHIGCYAVSDCLYLWQVLHFRIH